MSEQNGRKPRVGPNPHLAQVWTPDWLVGLLWRWMVRCGFNPAEKPTVLDLAAGAGHLVRPVAGTARLILNELDPAVIPELTRQFPSPPHTVYNEDFRRFRGHVGLGAVDAAVGSPPWKQDGEEYLPQAYLEVCESLVRPGGLIGLILPTWFTPIPGSLTAVASVNPSSAKLQDWPYPERPVVRIFRRPILTAKPASARSPVRRVR